VNLTRDEARALRVWMDEHGYTQQRDETPEAWRARTAPVSYVYALLIEAACEHRRGTGLSAWNCVLCGALIDSED